MKDPFYITPVLMGLSMFVMSWIGSRNMPPNPQAKMMMYMMPVMLTVFFLNLASGLNLYYAVQNIAAIPQQWLLARERAKEPVPAASRSGNAGARTEASHASTARPGRGVKITYIGHATLLLEIAGARILTDPNFDPQLGRFLPRVSAPGIALDALPALDAILLTHAHADHLSFDSLDRLPRDIPLYAPPAVARWLRGKGYAHVEPIAAGEDDSNRRGTSAPARRARNAPGQPLRDRPLAQRGEHVPRRNG